MEWDDTLMATYVTGTSITSFGVAISTFVEMLVSSGWTYKGSGDGVGTFSTTGKVFTGTGSGALGWNNANAWARLQDPSGTREFVIQHGSTLNGTVKLVYSPAAKFTGGSPSATVIPTAADEKYLLGVSGGAAQQLWPALLSSNPNNFYGYAASTAPYGFWFASSVSNAVQSGLALDPVKTPASDPDPYVWHVGTNGTQAAFTMGTLSLGRDGGTSGASVWGNSTTTGVTPGTGSFYGAFACMGPSLSRPMFYVQPASWCVGATATGSASGWNINGSGSLTTGIGQLGAGFHPFNPFSLTKVDTFPIAYVRIQNISSYNTPYPGIKGWSIMCRWTGAARVSFGDTMGSKAWICVGAMWLPWDGVTTPVG